MTPAEQARVDQLRATLTDALNHPCSCGECPSDELILAALALSDDALLVAARP